MKFKSYRLIDGQPKWVVVNQNGDILNRNPDKGELIGLKEEQYIKKRRKGYTRETLLGYLKQFYQETGRTPESKDFANDPRYPNFSTYFHTFGSWNEALKISGLCVNKIMDGNYNETNTCDRIKKVGCSFRRCGDPLVLYAYKEKKDGKETGKWLCRNCYDKDRCKFPDSHNNIVKGMRKWRNKQLPKNTTIGKGYIGEQIWCKWRGTENCNIKRDNFHSKEDSIDPEYGIVQVKLSTLIDENWNIKFQNYNFDTAVILFMDNNIKNIERMCIIPVNKLNYITYLRIRKDGKYKKNSKAAEICSRFYVEQSVCNNINDLYHTMNIEDCPVLI